MLPAAAVPHDPSLPVTLPLPGCGELCPLSSWLELTASLRPNDWEAECRTTVVQADTETASVDLPPLILLPSLVIVLMLFIFLVRLVVCCTYVHISQLHQYRTLPHIPGQQQDTRSGGENISGSEDLSLTRWW